MINQLEIRHFRYFLTLAECLHYREASEKLHISQSALSQQIQRMEVVLGHKLFERHNRKVTLSEAGLLFKDEAEVLLNQFNLALDRWHFKLEGGEGILKIGFVASAMQVFLPEVIKEFNDKHPKVKFYLEDLSNKEQLQALERNDLDIGFIRSIDSIDSMNSLSVLQENLTLVLPENHHINASNFENIGQLANESFILFPNEQSRTYYQQVENLCNEYGFSPNIKHRSIHGPTIFKLVEAGLGISVIPNSLKDHHNYKVQYIELTNIRQRTELFAFWHKANTNIALYHFLEVMRALI